MPNCIKCGGEIEGKPGMSICQDCVTQELGNKTPAELMALAKTGIDALIDEATGYQKMRAKGDLSRRLKKYQGVDED